jgi:hypothetical protein
MAFNFLVLEASRCWGSPTVFTVFGQKKAALRAAFW